MRRLCRLSLYHFTESSYRLSLYHFTESSGGWMNNERWLICLRDLALTRPSDERTNGRMDGRTDGRTYGRTDGRTYWRTDVQTDGRTDGRSDKWLTRRSICFSAHQESSGFVEAPPTAGRRRFRIWKRRRSRGEGRCPASAACPTAASREFAYLNKVHKTHEYHVWPCFILGTFI